MKAHSKNLNLTKEEARNTFEYRDGLLFWKPRHGGKWDVRWAGKQAGRRKFGANLRVDVCVNNQFYKAHRVIWNWWMGHIPAGMEIDHINGNPLDNRIENLRLCKPYENLLNKKTQSNNVNGIKNIYYDKERDSWVVRVKSKTEKFFQRFKNLEDAKTAAYEQRIKIHGKFACHGERDAEAL